MHDLDSVVTTEKDLRRSRNVALEDAARVVESYRFTAPGDGPLMLFEVRTLLARAIRRLVK